MECTFMPKRLGCAQGRKFEKLNIHNKYTELRNARIHRILFLISEMLLKFIIVYLFHEDVSSVSI